MTDLIDRQSLMERLEEAAQNVKQDLYAAGYDLLAEEIRLDAMKTMECALIGCVLREPTAAQPRACKGEWIPIADGDGAECSECGAYYDTVGINFAIFKAHHHFCPGCGADMSGIEKENLQ